MKTYAQPSDLLDKEMMFRRRVESVSILLYYLSSFDTFWTAFFFFFLEKQKITQVYHPPYSPD